jgi:hypothetical protein
MVIRSWFGPQEKDVPFRKLDFKEYLMTGQVKNPPEALGDGPRSRSISNFLNFPKHYLKYL